MSTATSRSWSIRGNITHYNAHGDEHVCHAIACRYGNTVFPGIRTAPWTFWGKRGTPDGRSIAQWENAGYVLYGIEGSRFDEHSPSGRVTTSCSARLMAEYLGVNNLPELQEILGYTEAADRFKGQTEFSLFRIMKEVYLFYPEQQDVVAAWAHNGLGSHLHSQWEMFNNPTPHLIALSNCISFDLALADYLCQYHQGYVEHQPALADAVRRYVKIGLPNDQAAKWLRREFPVLKDRTQKHYASLLLAQHFGLSSHPHFRMLLDYVSNSKTFGNGALQNAELFEVSSILKEIHLHKGVEAALDWASSAIGSKLFASHLYEEAGKEFEKATYRELPCKRETLLLAAIESDGPKISQYSRCKKLRDQNKVPDVLLQRKSTGHTTVFTNRQVDLRGVMRCLAKGEREAGGKPFDVYYHFMGDGNESIFNGSLSYPNDPATRLPFYQFKDAVVRGLLQTM